MFTTPSLVTRITIGKFVGMIIGLIGMIALPYFVSDASWFIRWGILLWYITLGAIIGVFGIFTEHPVLKLPMPWWFRSAILGAWMNFILVFFAYDTMKNMMVEFVGPEQATNNFLTSPFWFTLEGAIIGLIIGYFATKIGGEGKETVQA